MFVRLWLAHCQAFLLIQYTGTPSTGDLLPRRNLNQPFNIQAPRDLTEQLCNPLGLMHCALQVRLEKVIAEKSQAKEHEHEYNNVDCLLPV